MPPPTLPYAHRAEAGAVLARALQDYRPAPRLLVLALPRGGVPVAHAVAQDLGALLDVLVVRKLGYPGAPELAMGAIAAGGIRVMHLEPGLGPSPQAIDAIVQDEQRELERRQALYRGGRAPLDARGCTVLLVDDGLATGATMEAAVRAVREQVPAHVCVAVPVGARETCERLAALADRVVCPATPEPFRAVGLWYRDFGQTTDEEVQQLLGLHVAGPS